MPTRTRRSQGRKNRKESITTKSSIGKGGFVIEEPNFEVKKSVLSNEIYNKDHPIQEGTEESESFAIVISDTTSNHEAVSIDKSKECVDELSESNSKPVKNDLRESQSDLRQLQIPYDGEEILSSAKITDSKEVTTTCKCSIQ
jgi:hypothetical protein